MRETFFGDLIEEVEARIKKQQGETWDRELYENHLMGYTMRTEHHRLVLWKDTGAPDAEPIFTELYDYNTDPMETRNIADEHPELVAKLTAQFDAGWENAL